MVKNRLYKKIYKTGIVNNVFISCISLLFILSTNFNSHTLKVQTHDLFLIISLCIVCMSAVIFLSGYSSNNKIQNCSSIIVSESSNKNLKKVLKYVWLPIIPLCFSFFSIEDNIVFVLVILSILLLLIVKYIYFDNIVSFNNYGYCSGFDHVILNKNSNIKEIHRYKNIINEDFILFEIYEKDKFKGFDKFYESDFNYLCRKLNKIMKE